MRFFYTLNLYCILISVYMYIIIFYNLYISMNLKISSTQWTIFHWAISKMTVPTEVGEITIMPWHQPLSTIVLPGLVRVTLDASYEWDTDAFIMDAWSVVISVSKGLMMTDGTQTTITTSLATTSPSESADVLAQMKTDMEATLATIRETWNAEDIELAIANMDKINADIRLAKLG